MFARLTGTIAVALIFCGISIATAWADEPAGSQPLPAAATPTQDSPDIAKMYDIAMDDMLQGRLDKAIAGFDEVALRSVEPQRLAMAADFADRLRKKQQTALAEMQKNAIENDASEGRTPLLITSTVFGLAAWGWMVPGSFDVQNSQAQVGLYMLSSGASFAVPYFATRDAPVTAGMAHAFFSGGTRGLLTGYLARMALHTPTNQFDSSLGSESQVDSSLLLASLTGSIGGLLWAREAKIDAGSAHITGIGGDFGFFDGFMLASILRLNDTHTKAQFTLLGGGLGYVGGAVFSHYREMTWGDSEVLRMSGLLGMLAAAVPLAWAERKNDERIPFSVLTVGSVVGLVVGDRLTVDRDIDVATALIVDLATVAGGLVGLGTVFLVQGNQNSKAGPLVTGAMLGAGLSFFLSYRLSDKPAVHNAAQQLQTWLPALPQVSLAPLILPDGGRGLSLGGTF